ncbi:hypothetical protein TNCT_696231 [Trichonephila clavata]|uniref:Uncharacterized protein n=1 Tax=Trichonephila clavata TaxID=2740835 RepID=A0A8X6GKT2_TRICU|nr:hypothetical protein TNCT_696231 [Trichonephila clavata]
MRIGLESQIAVVMVEYPIMSETCFISPHDMFNETIIYVLLLQQPFTEGHAFRTVIWFHTLHGWVPKRYSFSDRKSLCTVLLLEVISRSNARVLTSRISPTWYSIA